uniref:Protein D1 n=1 Tax=Lygus hesperus TaxID=30085 RepID=A0A146KTY3_LYGHE
MMSWITVSLFICFTSQALGGDYAFLVNSGCDFGELILTQTSAQNVTVTKKNCDTLFRKTDWQHPPNVVFPNAKDNKKYMILMLDPDAPNHPEGVFYFHWAVANIPGKNLKSGGDVSKGTTLLSYAGPTPPKGSGQHRYVFLVYEQDTQQGIMEKPEKRAHFDLGRWINPLAKRHPLTGPVAGSQFRVPAE